MYSANAWAVYTDLICIKWQELQLALRAHDQVILQTTPVSN